LKVSPIGSRFGGGQSGKLDEGVTGSVHFLWTELLRDLHLVTVGMVSSSVSSSFVNLRKLREVRSRAALTRTCPPA
jgi:hypothetical protein